MTIQKKFRSIARRLLFIQSRLYKESSSEQVRKIQLLAEELRNLLDAYFGPKIAREITWEEGEK